MITDDLWAILEPLVIQVINYNLHEVCAKRNQSRTPRLVEEVRHLKALPARRQESVRTMKVKVQSGSTISVERNIDSVPARLSPSRPAWRPTPSRSGMARGMRLVVITAHTGFLIPRRETRSGRRALGRSRPG